METEGNSAQLPRRRAPRGLSAPGRVAAYQGLAGCACSLENELLPPCRFFGSRFWGLVAWGELRNSHVSSSESRHLVFLIPALQAPFQKGPGPGSSLSNSSDCSLCPGAPGQVPRLERPSKSPSAVLCPRDSHGPRRTSQGGADPPGAVASPAQRRGARGSESLELSGLKFVFEIHFPKLLMVGAGRRGPSRSRPEYISAGTAEGQCLPVPHSPRGGGQQKAFWPGAAP